LNDGSGWSAAGNFAGAAGDITSLVLTGARVVPGYGWALGVGSFAIFMAEQVATSSLEADAAQQIGAHYSDLKNSEGRAVGRIAENQQLYDTNCSGR